MALQHLTDELIPHMDPRAEGPLVVENVFRGDMAQLTLRSAVTGFFLGGILAATALYIAGKTGITIGVGLTSVILAFAMYRIMNSMGFAEDFTILENNCTQSIATAAGYMVTPLVSSLAAYMLVTNTIIPAAAHDRVDVRVLHPGRAHRLPDEAPLHQRGAAALPGRARRGRGARRALHGRPRPRACTRRSCWRALRSSPPPTRRSSATAG
jgi:hypothetical protein